MFLGKKADMDSDLVLKWTAVRFVGNWPVFPLTAVGGSGECLQENSVTYSWWQPEILRSPVEVGRLSHGFLPRLFLYPWWENAPDVFHQQPGWSVTPAFIRFWVDHKWFIKSPRYIFFQTMHSPCTRKISNTPRTSPHFVVSLLVLFASTTFLGSLAARYLGPWKIRKK